MAPPKRYRVLVGSECVYVGSWRTADTVYRSLRHAFELIDPHRSLDLVLTLAFDL